MSVQIRLADFMNSDKLANLISFGFGIYILYCFIYGFFFGKSSTNIPKISDDIDIGYIKIDKPVVTINQKPKQAVEKIPNLKLECVRILIAIGYSPEIAKQMVKDFFAKDTAKDLEEFFVKINKS